MTEGHAKLDRPAAERPEDAATGYVPPPPKPLSPAGEQWLAENREAILQFNEWIAEHGLPLERYRLF